MVIELTHGSYSPLIGAGEMACLNRLSIFMNVCHEFRNNARLRPDRDLRQFDDAEVSKQIVTLRTSCRDSTVNSDLRITV